MRVSLNWLAEFLELPSFEALCAALTQAGIEVDRVIDPSARVQGVVVAEIVAVAAHPTSDKLTVCNVFDGRATHKVVCGAPNVRSPMKVAYAPLGAQLPRPGHATGLMTIESRALRGVTSAGMLCAREELNLASDLTAGLWELDDAIPVGTPIFDAYPQSISLELGVTPNRADCLSHLGIARELAAATGQRLGSPKWRLLEKGPEATSLGRVLNEDPSGCKRYVARVVTGIKVGPSPKWLRDRLAEVGQRSVNNVVDATNYVLYELGQPIHAYDLNQIATHAGCPTVRVRAAEADETVQTLDKATRRMKGGEIVIADASRILALAGVMGGADSEVTEATGRVLLEAAFFDPTRIRRAARSASLRTEASLRFERGTDIAGVQKAIDRCAQLIVDVAGGDVAKGILEGTSRPEPSREIALRPAQLVRLLGLSLTAEAIVALLEPLEIRCVRRTQDALLMMPPSFRPDLSREVDLVEEVARRYGYDALPEKMPSTAGAFVYRPVSWRAGDLARASLLAQSMTEIVTYAFLSPTAVAPYAERFGEPVRLQNPLGEEHSVLRTTLVPNLLRVAAHNLRHGNGDLRLFEVGTCFSRRGKDGTGQNNRSLVGDAAGRPVDDHALPLEDVRVAFLLTGARISESWSGDREAVDLSDLTGIAENLFEAFDSVSLPTRKAAPVCGLNPFASADLFIGDKTLGFLGQVSTEVAHSVGITKPLFVAEISLSTLMSLPRRATRSNPLPRYPKTRRDVAVITTGEARPSCGVLLDFIKTHAAGDLDAEVSIEVRLFDVYSGAPLLENQQSLAFAIEFRHPGRTLTDLEVGRAFASLQVRLTKAFPIQIRDA